MAHLAMNNPFLDDEKDNPFESSAERLSHPPAQQSQWSNVDTRSSYSGYTPDPPRHAPPPAPASMGGSSGGKTAKELELERREAELRAREAKLVERENAVEFQKPNWPRFRPMVYHDIDKDIPESGRWLVKRVYVAWWIAIVTYVMNCAAAFSCLVTKAESAGGTFGVALIVLVIGTPVSFVFWYRPLYTGVKFDRSISFFFFFFNYAAHLAVMALFAIGVPGWGGANLNPGFVLNPTNLLHHQNSGVIITISQLGNNVVSGIFCAIASALLIFQCVNGLWQIKNVTAYYRSKGLSVDQARNEAAAGIAQSRVGRDIATHAVKSQFTGAGRV
ncbi:hypothetical protein HK104_001009 [Borealophlyctis nickersoniae]|nr:hypothetical protein HK104_001009 [Borealophlyctis nickersoniae]